MHVFFYSKKSIKMIAKKYNYDVWFFDNQYALFYKKNYISNLKLKILNFFFNKYATKLIRMYLTILPARGIEKDKKQIS